MRIMVTGHRPPRLCGGYENWIETSESVAAKRFFTDSLEELLAEKDQIGGSITAACGMAQGADWLFALSCISLQIPFLAFIPYPRFGYMWPSAAQEDLKKLLGKSAEVKTCSPFFFIGAEKQRDMEMVNWISMADCSGVLAVWDGEPNGGTYTTIRMAQKKAIPVLSYEPNHGGITKIGAE